MPLDGINKKCESCIMNCKQWKQVIILICPIYHPRKIELKKSEEIVGIGGLRQ
jgi:hypothetical protein